jgi:hypothetical protein
MFTCGLLLVGCGVQTSEEPLTGGDGHGHDAGGAGGGGTESAHGEDILDAADVEAPVYIKLGLAPLATPPAGPLGWDLRVAKTMLATNGGTSGEGTAGAIATNWTSIDDEITCPQEGYEPDAMLPVPGPPGSGEFSGNPVLNGWYDYDPATHAVTTKGLVYCIRTTDDKYGAIRIKNYAGGQMTLQWRFQPSGEAAL